MVFNENTTDLSPTPATRQAVLHLLLHCCQVDGEWNEAELKTVFSIATDFYGADQEWLQEQTARYHRHAADTKHHPSYLPFLVRQINPSDSKALLWRCAQVTVADGTVSFAEELLVEKLAALLSLSGENAREAHRVAWMQHMNEQHGSYSEN